MAILLCNFIDFIMNNQTNVTENLLIYSQTTVDMFNYLMLKENTCFSKAISHAKVDLMCVPLSKIDREKKVQKSRTQLDHVVFEGIFLLLCICVFTRFEYRFVYLIFDDMALLKNRSKSR